MLRQEHICEENKQDIISFSKVRLAKGSGHGRVAKIVYCLRNMAKWLNKPFRQATKDDLIGLVGDLESNVNYAEHTKYDYKVVLKMLYKWLLGNDEIYPPSRMAASQPSASVIFLSFRKALARSRVINSSMVDPPIS